MPGFSSEVFIGVFHPGFKSEIFSRNLTAFFSLFVDETKNVKKMFHLHFKTKMI